MTEKDENEGEVRQRRMRMWKSVAEKDENERQV